MTKEETISKLYGLRAGLSLIAEKKVEAQNEYKNANQLKESLDEKKRKLANSYYDLSILQNRIKNEKERSFVDTGEGYDLYEKVSLAKVCSIPFCGHACLKTVNGKWTALFVLNLLTSVIVAACAGIIFVTLTNNSPIMIASFATTGALFGWVTYSPIVCSILPINLLWYLHLKRKYKKEEKKFKENQNNVVIPQEKKNFSIMKQKYEQDSEMFAIYKSRELAKIEQVNQQGNNHINSAKQIKQQITATYSPFLVKEDWKNIDLMIFYLQTGRADNLKEALILADRQRQTDAIVNEISKATATIANTINTGFAYVGEGLKQINTNLATLVDEVALQNALTRYSNTKIEELIDAVNDISIPSTIDARIVN